MAYVVWHVQDAAGKPISGAVVRGSSQVMGNWSAVTNACGDAKTTLGAAVYDMTFEAFGFQTRTYPATIGDSGEIVTGLERGANPPEPGPDPGPLPIIPTRDQVCKVRAAFQGETAQTIDYGTFPVFGLETSTLSYPDLHAYCAQLAGRGWTHGMIAVSWAYNEPGFLMPVPGRDLSQEIPELAHRIKIMLEHFTAVMVFCAGDGLSKPKSQDGTYPYNDPVGHTYGYEWLCDNFPRIAQGLKESAYGDLTKYLLFVPGFDGVFYGWGYPGEVPDRQPDRVVHFGQVFRSALPDGYLAIEHTPGNIPVGEGGSDWASGGRMQCYDCVLSEFNWPATGDQVWQVVGRLNRPYHRPPDQPAGDDPNPPWYLEPPTPRGPVFYVPFEYATYQWTRGQVTAEQVQAARQYFYDLGCHDVC